MGEREEAQLRELAREAYKGYEDSTGKLTFDGRVMPEWAMLPAKTQEAWKSAVSRVVLHVAERSAGYLSALQEHIGKKP